MSATNSTPNYGLPQYVADDKPTYLGDFNKAMLDIDTNMKSIENKAESAESASTTANSNASQALENANQASTKADNAQATATAAQSTATTAKNTADTAQSTATSAQSIANTANSTVENLKNDIANWDNQDIKPSTNNQYIAQSSFSCNKLLKLVQLFGRVNANNTDIQAPFVIGKLPSYIKPKTLIRVFGGSQTLSGTEGIWVPEEMNINTDGTITLPVWSTKFKQARWNVTLNISDTSRWEIN